MTKFHISESVNAILGEGEEIRGPVTSSNSISCNGTVYTSSDWPELPIGKFVGILFLDGRYFVRVID